MSFIPADYLLHLSNVLLLIAYSVRSILWLRIFAVAASIAGIPYFVLQPSILWPPIGWSVVFILINFSRICLLLWERRPIVFSEEERKLYDMGFQAIAPQDFVSLVMAGRWENAAAGDKLLAEGTPSESICIAISGTIEVRRQQRSIGEVGPGHILGTAIALMGEPSPIDAIVLEPARYICWSLSSIRAFLDKKPELRAALQRMASEDLARKLHRVVTAQP